VTGFRHDLRFPPELCMRVRPLPWLLLCALVVGAAARAAGAGDGEPPSALTALEAGPYRSADAVLVGRVAHVTNVRAPGGTLGRQVARVRVERVFKGDHEAGDQVAVTVHGQRPTLDPARPSIPYFRAGEEQRFVLFLVRSRTGATYRLHTLYDAGGKVGDEKIAAVAAVAEVAALSDPDARARRTVSFLVAGLKASGRWTKAHAARELTYLAGVAPAAIDAATAARIRRLPPAALTPDQRFWLRILFQLLAERGPAEKRPSDASDAETDPWRQAFLATSEPEARKTSLARLAASGKDAVERHGWWAWSRVEPSVRVWFARLLGDRAATTAARMRAAYAGEEETEVRSAIVRAVGLLGAEEDVRWLAERLGNIALRRTALLALARVRTADARAHLEEARQAAEARDERDLAAWLEHLLSPAFAESDRQARAGGTGR
jgi:hypothetical protein